MRENTFDEIVKLFDFRITPRLDGKYTVLLSKEKPAFKITMNKRGHLLIFPHNPQWEFLMLHDRGLQNYLNKLLACLYAYKKEVDKLISQQNLLKEEFSNKKSPAI